MDNMGNEAHEPSSAGDDSIPGEPTWLRWQKRVRTPIVKKYESKADPTN